MAIRIRYDKAGKQLPDTGRGCGCRQCEASGAPRYERRAESPRGGGRWNEVQRRLVKLIRHFEPPEPLMDSGLAAHYRGRFLT